MIKFKHLLVTIILLLSISGCQGSKSNQAEHDAKVAQEARNQLIKEQAEAKREQEELAKNNKLSQIGIASKDGKIVIDTNKTKRYFKNLAQQIKTKMDKMSKDLDKGIVKNKEAGIDMDETHINIDLNKTKYFLDTWGKKIQDYVKSFDEITKEFDTKNNTVKDKDATN